MKFLNDIRALAKDSIIYGLSTSLSKGASLLMAPILTRIFVPEEYGLIALIQLAISFFIIIAGMNIMSGMSFYYFQEEDTEKRKIVLSTSFIFIFSFTFAVSILLYTYSRQIAEMLSISGNGIGENYDLALYLQISSLGLFFSLLLSGFQMIIRLIRKPKLYLKTELVSLLSQIATVLLLVVWLELGIIGVFWANTFAAFCACIYSMTLVRKQFSFKFSLVLLMPILAYAIPQIPGVMINWAQSQLGRIFLSNFSTLTELGLYSIGFTISSVIALLVTAFRMSYDPYALSVMKQKDAKEFYAKMYDFYIAIFSWFLAGIALFAKPILIILTPSAYHSASSFVLVLSTATLFMGANNILATGIWISKKTIYTSYAQLISFGILFLSNYILVPIYGGTGAAIAFLLGALAQSFAYYIFAQYVWEIPYRYWRAHMGLLLVFSYCYAHNHYIIDASLSVTLIGGLFSLTIVSGYLILFSLNKKERLFLREHLMPIFKKL